MIDERKLSLSLLVLRLSVFVVMLVWSVDKFVRPEHAAAVFERFYLIDNLTPTGSYLIGAVQLAIVLGFVAGFQKKWTYGAIFVLHAISTLSSYRQYLDPYQPGAILFYAAWPMLAACFALYVLRENDTRWSWD